MVLAKKNRYVSWFIGFFVVLVYPGITAAKNKSSGPSKKLLAVKPTIKDLQGLCTVGGDYPGSLHAAVLSKTLLEPAQGGTHYASYLCNGTPAALYLFDFGNEQKAKEQLAFLGGRLWGGPGPNPENPDEILYQGSIIAVVSSKKPGDLARILLKKKLERYNTSEVIGFLGGEVTSPEKDLAATDLHQIRGFVECSKAPERQLYCQLLDRFEKGRPLGSQSIGLPGVALRIDLDTSKVPVRWTEEADYLVVTSQGAAYGTIRPTSGEEDEQTRNFISAVHNSQPLSPNHPLAEFARSMITQASFRTTSKVGQSTVYGHNSKVYMRDCGDGIAVIETFQSGRLFYLGWFPKSPQST